MGIPTLISTSTASNAASVAITSGIDSTYDEYMFVFTDIGPATDNTNFTFQCSTDGGSNYNLTLTSTAFAAFHSEDNSEATLTYRTGSDLAQSTGFQHLAEEVGGGSDESSAGILHLFTPSNTTYVKHFYSRFNEYTADSKSHELYAAGYFNTTSDIDAIQFKMASGNFDGVIQMYGIA